MYVRRCGRDSGCCKRSHLARSSFHQHAGTRLQRRPGRAHVVHEDDAETSERSWSPGEDEGVANVGVPFLGRESRLRAGVSPPPEQIADWKAEPGCQFAGLVEAASPLTAPVQRDRNGEIRAAQNRSTM